MRNVVREMRRECRPGTRAKGALATFAFALLCVVSFAGCQPESARFEPKMAVIAPPPAPPQIDATSRFETRSIDRAVQSAIARGDVPGAVVVVVDRDGTLFSRAYGDRATVPNRESMTEDTVFDLASLTKPLAAASSILALAEDGSLDLRARASKYLPELAAKDATIEDLLLHVAGLPADAPMDRVARTREEASNAALSVAPIEPPKKAFRYSDLGYLALGAVVEKVSHERLDAFASERFFRPLAMHDTSFVPDPSLTSRIAPTTFRGTVMLRGTVHDPRAAELEGVAGHAGLFASGPDLGRFARMLLRGGELDGTRVLSETTVRELFRAREVPSGKRSLGWDVHTGYSHERGEVFGDDGIGHTGFTGTSMWIDREMGLGVVVLASRLHPDGKGDAKRLRREVANAVAHARRGDARSGIDVLEDHDFREVSGAKLAVLTNDACRDLLGERTLDALTEKADVRVVLTAEHGLGVNHEGGERARIDPKTKLPLIDVYGDSLRSLPLDLRGADTLVIDLPDVGARFFTYAATAEKVADAARQRGMKVLVLDRENPLGKAVEGPRPDSSGESLVSFFDVPVRHGLTLAGLLRLRGDVDSIDSESRAEPHSPFAHAGSFLAPSPNLRSHVAELLYPGVALLELTNVSVGRGTSRPFEELGAPWMDGTAIVEALSHLETPGLHAEPVSFTPSSGPFEGERCRGVRFFVDDEDAFRPVRLGVALALALRATHPHEFDPRGMKVLLANRATYDAILRGDSLDQIVASWSPGT